MGEDVRNYLEMHGISDVTSNEFILAEDTTQSDATLTLQNLTYNDLPYMLPEMETKTSKPTFSPA